MMCGVRRKSHPVFFRGFTLVEFIAVFVIVTLIAVFALVTSSTGPAVAGYQADGLRNSVRHMQELAMTWGKQLRLTVAAGSYSVSCVTAEATAPCNASPVTDPATGSAFSVTAESGVTLAVTSPVGLDFAVDGLGRPMNCNPTCALLGVNGTFTASAGGQIWTVQVSPLTGFITVN